MAREQDLLSQLHQIARSLNTIRTRMSAEPQVGQHINALRRLDRAELTLLDAIGAFRKRIGAPPIKAPARPRGAGGMVACPHCSALVKQKNLDRHVRTVHGASAGPGAGQAEKRQRQPSQQQPPLRPPALRSTPKRSARGPASPGVSLPGPTHVPSARPEQGQPRMERLADSDTLRQITLELELLNRDLYRDD